MSKEIPKTIKTPEKTPEREIKYTENGFWQKIMEKDEKGKLIYERKREFKNSAEPKESEIKYDYEKHFCYDEKGNVMKEEGKSFDHESGWKKEFEWKNGKLVSEIGEKTIGPDQGHKWIKKFQYDEKGNMVQEIGEILEQGKNPTKSPKGHAWKTTHLYDKNGNWVGEIGEITGGPETGKVWTKGKVSKENLKNL